MTGDLHSLRMGDGGRKRFPKLAPELGKKTRGQLSRPEFGILWRTL